MAVWLGSTNLTENGLFGHLNCGHVIEDAAVAGAYLAYWNEIAADPEAAPERTWMAAHNPAPPQPWNDDLVEVAGWPSCAGTPASPPAPAGAVHDLPLRDARGFPAGLRAARRDWTPQFLSPSDKWQHDHFREGSSRWLRRRYFAGLRARARRRGHTVRP
jgi:hypothetical protein